VAELNSTGTHAYSNHNPTTHQVLIVLILYIICMVLLTVRTHGPYYTNSGYLPCALCARPVQRHNG